MSNNKTPEYYGLLNDACRELNGNGVGVSEWHAYLYDFPYAKTSVNEYSSNSSKHLERIFNHQLNNYQNTRYVFTRILCRQNKR